MAKFAVELRSEFAAVRVALDETGNGPRLKIEDLRTGRTAWLDPLELETLAWTRHEDLAPFLNPSLGRWRDPDDPGFEQILRNAGVRTD